MNYYFTYQTKFGVGAIIGDSLGIKYHLLPETRETQLLKQIKELTLGKARVNIE